jgi:tripartite-type tricarboxylate transporter receptor subunit TctC
VPAGTPTEVQLKLHAAITAALNDPELQQLYAKQGGEAAPMSQAAFTAMVRTEGEKWGSLAKAVGAKFD